MDTTITRSVRCVVAELRHPGHEKWRTPLPSTYSSASICYAPPSTPPPQPGASPNRLNRRHTASPLQTAMNLKQLSRQIRPK